MSWKGRGVPLENRVSVWCKWESTQKRWKEERQGSGWLSEVIWFSTKSWILKMSRQNIKKRGKRPHSWCVNIEGDAEDFPSLSCRLRSLSAAYAGFWRSHLSACARPNAFISRFYPRARNLVPAPALPSTAQQRCSSTAAAPPWAGTDIRMQAASTAHCQPCITNNQFPSPFHYKH